MQRIEEILKSDILKGVEYVCKGDNKALSDFIRTVSRKYPDVVKGYEQYGLILMIKEAYCVSSSCFRLARLCYIAKTKTSSLEPSHIGRIRGNLLYEYFSGGMFCWAKNFPRLAQHEFKQCLVLFECLGKTDHHLCIFIKNMVTLLEVECQLISLFNDIFDSSFAENIKKVSNNLKSITPFDSKSLECLHLPNVVEIVCARYEYFATLISRLEGNKFDKITWDHSKEIFLKHNLKEWAILMDQALLLHLFSFSNKRDTYFKLTFPCVDKCEKISHIFPSGRKTIFLQDRSIDNLRMLITSDFEDCFGCFKEEIKGILVKSLQNVHIPDIFLDFEHSKYEEKINLKDENYLYNLLGLEIDYIDGEPNVYFELYSKDKKLKKRYIVPKFSKSEKNFVLLTRLAVAMAVSKEGWIYINGSSIVKKRKKIHVHTKSSLYSKFQELNEFRSILANECEIFSLSKDEKRKLLRTHKGFNMVRLAIPKENIKINIENLKNFESRFTNVKGDAYYKGNIRIKMLIQDARESFENFITTPKT